MITVLNITTTITIMNTIIREQTVLRVRMGARKMRLAWRERPGTVWFAAWAVAFMIYLGIGLTPAVASEYEIIGRIEIPEAAVSSEVAKVTLTNGEVPTPENLVGEFQRQGEKTLLVGHATGVFSKLSQIEIGDEIDYLGAKYTVVNVGVLPKNEIRMNKLLSGDEGNLVLMTCAGELYANGDASERLIVEAEKI